MKHLKVLNLKLFFVLIVTTFITVDTIALEIDLSRRRKKVQKQESEVPTIAPTAQTNTQPHVKPIKPDQSKDGFFDLFTSSEPTQELVILNTDHGFVPSKVSLKKGAKYTIHVVNVNEKNKNVSFILDSFSEHHATYFGKAKSFTISPAQEGIYSFQCPETSAEGRLVIFSAEPQQRAISSESKE